MIVQDFTTFKFDNESSSFRDNEKLCTSWSRGASRFYTVIHMSSHEVITSLHDETFSSADFHMSCVYESARVPVVERRWWAPAAPPDLKAVFIYSFIHSSFSLKIWKWSLNSSDTGTSNGATTWKFSCKIINLFHPNYVVLVLFLWQQNPSIEQDKQQLSKLGLGILIRLWKTYMNFIDYFKLNFAGFRWNCLEYTFLKYVFI